MNEIGGNIPGGNFPGGNFPGGVWWVGIFRERGIFLEPENTKKQQKEKKHKRSHECNQMKSYSLIIAL